MFAILDKGDSLSFKELETNEIIIKPDFDFPQEKNIVYKAVQALREYTNVIKGIEITINKNIPMGGGLGGGSSNAATALVALNSIWKLNINEDKLCEIGKKLGADVPVFIKGRSAFAEGVGEKLTPFEIEESYYLVVTPKNTNVSTKEIFTHPNLPRNTPKFSIDEINSVKLKNDCEELVKNNYPIVWKNPDAKPIEGEADTELRDTEIVPFNYKGGIDAFMKNEVLSYAPDAYIDEKKTQIGYEISFTKYFYKPIELRDMNDILTSLNDLEKQTDGVLAEIIGGICK